MVQRRPRGWWFDDAPTRHPWQVAKEQTPEEKARTLRRSYGELGRVMASYANPDDSYLPDYTEMSRDELVDLLTPIDPFEIHVPTMDEVAEHDLPGWGGPNQPVGLGLADMLDALADEYESGPLTSPLTSPADFRATARGFRKRHERETDEEVGKLWAEAEQRHMERTFRERKEAFLDAVFQPVIDEDVHLSTPSRDQIEERLRDDSRFGPIDRRSLPSEYFDPRTFVDGWSLDADAHEQVSNRLDEISGPAVHVRCDYLEPRYPEDDPVYRVEFRDRTYYFTPLGSSDSKVRLKRCERSDDTVVRGRDALDYDDIPGPVLRSLEDHGVSTR